MNIRSKGWGCRFEPNGDEHDTNSDGDKGDGDGGSFKNAEDLCVGNGASRGTDECKRNAASHTSGPEDGLPPTRVAFGTAAPVESGAERTNDDGTSEEHGQRGQGGKAKNVGCNNVRKGGECHAKVDGDETFHGVGQCLVGDAHRVRKVSWELRESVACNKDAANENADNAGTPQAFACGVAQVRPEYELSEHDRLRARRASVPSCDQGDGGRHKDGDANRTKKHAACGANRLSKSDVTLVDVLI